MFVVMLNTDMSWFQAGMAFPSVHISDFKKVNNFFLLFKDLETFHEI